VEKDLSTVSQSERVLLAAMRVLTRGASQLTVRNVAEEAQCSTTGVYTYFGSKQGLVDALYIRAAASFGRALESADGDLLATGRAYRRWALAYPSQYRLVFGGAVADFIPSEEALLVAAESFEHLVSLIGERDQAMHVWATVHGYVSLELVGMAAPDAKEAEKVYEQGLWAIGEWLGLTEWHKG